MASSWVPVCREFKNGIFNERTVMYFVALEISGPCLDAGHAEGLLFFQKRDSGGCAERSGLPLIKPDPNRDGTFSLLTE